MGIFNKKEKVPELAPASGIPNLPNESRLPAINSSSESLNRDMVKSAITDDGESHFIPSGKDEVNMESPSKDFHFNQEENKKEEETYLPSLPAENAPQRSAEEQIFVRIDKFQDAEKSFETVRKSVKSVESAFEKMKNIKDKEDKEIDDLTSELFEIKAKLESIDANIFEKI